MIIQTATMNSSGESLHGSGMTDDASIHQPKQLNFDRSSRVVTYSGNYPPQRNWGLPSQPQFNYNGYMGPPPSYNGNWGVQAPPPPPPPRNDQFVYANWGVQAPPSPINYNGYMGPPPSYNGNWGVQAPPPPPPPRNDQFVYTNWGVQAPPSPINYNGYMGPPPSYL